MATLLATLAAGILCFMAATLSSAGGVGGGSLYLLIVNLVAGLDLKTASTFSAFMVTGGSLSSVIFSLAFTKPTIDYEIALLSEPCMLLGVSAGVLCNVMFPEWLVTALFALFLGFSTYKTAAAGVRCWSAESSRDALGDDGKEKLLAGENTEDDEEIPWGKMAVLLAVWVTFFALHLIIADNGATKMIRIRPCGVIYWLVTSFQVPLAVGFTACILHQTCRTQQQIPDHEKDDDHEVTVQSRIKALPTFVFPLAALLSGVLGGLFGIGGGILINPVLLQIGIPPQVTASTTSFMVLFSSSMSMAQYLIIGMRHIWQAVVFATVCFVASALGLVLVQKAMEKSGRASIIVFSVSTVMALSTVSITGFGAMDVWREYKRGDNMGFKPLC